MSTFSMDPNLAGLLRELEADDKSRTLKVGALARGLGDLWKDDDWIRPTLTGLSSIEKQILDVHREEVAFAYRQYVSSCLANQERVKTWDHGHYTVHSRRVLPTTGECERQLKATANVSLGTGFDSPEVPTRLELKSAAATAESLRPTAQGSIYLGLIGLVRGDEGSERSEFRRAAERSTTGLVRSIAWNNLGLAYLLGAELSLAHDSYERACWYQPDSTPALFGRLYVALLLQDSELVEKASVDLDEVVPHDHPAIDAYLV